MKIQNFLLIITIFCLLPFLSNQEENLKESFFKTIRVIHEKEARQNLIAFQKKTGKIIGKNHIFTKHQISKIQPKRHLHKQKLPVSSFYGIHPNKFHRHGKNIVKAKGKVSKKLI